MDRFWLEVLISFYDTVHSVDCSGEIHRCSGIEISLKVYATKKRPWQDFLNGHLEVKEI